ncbi:ABC-2 type transport system permease protein [Methanomicrobium sp. W14]|uniref:ABC transporter permease n=1 Tax=Methanomicrobium sp. W14 TaxID=2817839 RepID=UPI001AE55CB2|nr:ABC-2 type transport system permease protein [Methanomicrobium sp. W14]
MDLNRLKVISQKEFSDQITSKKFIILFCITCIVLGVAGSNGVTNYKNSLESYNNGDEGVLFFPSVLEVFNSITNVVGIDGLGIIIGIAIGFDLVSGEREGRSLKTILSRPVYRDELINGKAIGGIAAIAVVTLAGFIAVCGVLLVFGVVPSVDEVLLIGFIWLLTMLFMTYSFSLSLMSSVFARTSGGALVLSFLVVLCLVYVIPSGGGDVGTYLILGQEPSKDNYDMGSYMQSEAFDEAKYQYEKNELEVHDFFNMFSVGSVYNDIASAITLPSSYVISEKIGFLSYSLNPDLGADIEKPTFWETLGDKWVKLIVFIAWPVLFFGIAYVKFMRIDLR